jgi:hypothetical protein
VKVELRVQLLVSTYGAGIWALCSTLSTGDYVWSRDVNGRLHAQVLVNT